jgi:hypothetical protein
MAIVAVVSGLAFSKSAHAVFEDASENLQGLHAVPTASTIAWVTWENPERF